MAKAHIIPKSLYGVGLKDGQAKLFSNVEGDFPKRSPIGVYDPDIVCIDCEARFTKCDDYACKFFMKTKPEPVFHQNGASLAGKFQNFDRHNLRMFFVSLLWRMQVTKQAMFSQIRLGKYEEHAKSSILKEDPDLIPELDVTLSKFDSNTSVAFLGPTRLRMEGINGYRVCFAYHSCWVKVDKRPFPNPFDLIAISLCDPLHILHQEFDGSPEKRALVETLRQ